MNVAGYKILRILSVFIFLYTIATAIPAFADLGCIDFPCFAYDNTYYDETNHCIYEEGLQHKTRYQIEVFLSTYDANLSGGGCDYQYTENNTLDIETPVTNLRLKREEEILTVNGRVLRNGKEFRTTRILHWNPWIVSWMKFENAGLVSDCGSTSTNQRIAIIGEYGTKVSLIKGISVLLVSIGGFIFAYKKNRRLTCI